MTKIVYNVNAAYFLRCCFTCSPANTRRGDDATQYRESFMEVMDQIED